MFVLLWSTGFIVARYGTNDAGPFTFLGIRLTIAAAVLAVAAAASGAPRPTGVQVRWSMVTVWVAGFAVAICGDVTVARADNPGPETILEKIGVEPTGMPFNSVIALELEPNRSVNPFVNAGAMAAVSLVKAASPQEKWEKILAQYSKFAGEKLSMSEEVYQSEASSNQHNRGIAELLASYNRLYADPLETCDVYTKQCSVLVTAKQLAVMGATIANGGVNPITKERCLDEASVPKLLAVMMIAGFYDESGAWAWKSGLPSKTGVGGGIVSVVPGKMAIVGFSPPLDAAGNSVRGASAIHQIVSDLNLNLFNTK
jgi:glutaminase